MVPENYQKLIKKLIAKTKENKALWSKTSGEDEYKLELENGAITTDSFKIGSARFVDFRLWNNTGEVIDGLSYSVGSTEYSLVIELHSVAKRTYYKVDQVLDNIFNELDSDRTIGERSKQEDDDLPF